jgi:LEA14-like dessication related protein
MKKLKLLLIVLIIANLIFASILLSDIQMFESPDILMKVDILEINSEEAVIKTEVTIYNSNNFDLIVSDLEILSKTKDGEKVGDIIIDGGKVKSNNEKSFSSIDSLRFQSTSFDVIENTVSAKVGVNILGFITKTIPLKISAIVSLKKVIDSLKSPDININFNFDEINTAGLNFSALMDIYNPNDFEFNIDSILLDIYTEKNENVGNMEIFGDTVKPKESKQLSSKGLIEFDALDAETLWINVSGIAGAKIAGMNKNISFTTEAGFDIPDIKSFIFDNESIDISLPVQFKFTITGLMSTVGLRIYNPSDVPLVTENLVCSISRFDGDKISVLGEENMDVCNISPHKTICIKTQILIPYLKYLFSGSGKLLPDWIILNIQGDFSIAGTRQTFPLSISAYVDPHFLRNSEFLIPEVS